MRTLAHGRLRSEPISRQTRAGSAMVTTSLGINVAKAGEPDDLEWLQIAAFGETADVLAQHKRGDRITVTGDFRRNRYTGRDGQERTSWNVTVDGILSEQVKLRAKRTASRRRESFASPSMREPVPDLSAGGFWIAMPSQKRLDCDGNPVTGDNGKPVYSEFVGFRDRGVRDRFNSEVIEAVRREHPEALA
jgi:single-stranded DNA-binding protein